MSSAKKPIGIFDSGIGGLTIAKAVTDLLPNEQIIYFGDTAHLPYGDKSPQLIQSFATQITTHLLERENCKAIVVACNTASATSYEFLRDHYKGDVPIINVIDPIIEAIVADTEISKVGLIATKTTVESGVYQEKLTRRKPNIQFEVLATPLLAPMIEEGFGNDEISQAVISNYIKTLKNIDALILGCTHYGLIKEEINQFFKHEIKLFDSGKILAQKLKNILDHEGLLAEKKNKQNRFFVSDYTESFEKSTRLFYSEQLNLEYLPIWEKKNKE